MTRQTKKYVIFYDDCADTAGVVTGAGVIMDMFENGDISDDDTVYEIGPRVTFSTLLIDPNIERLKR